MTNAYKDLVWSVKYNLSFVMSFMYQYYVYFAKLIRKVSAPDMPYTIVKVLKHNDAENSMTDVSDEYFVDGKIPACNEDERLEYHTTFNHRPYRIVSTRQTTLEPNLGLFQKPRGMNDPFKNPRIVSATICQKFDNEETDVLNRVFQYAGPNHDFFGQTLKTRWLFPPYTDTTTTNKHESITEDETTLHVLYSNGVSTHFSPDECIKKF